VFDTIHSRSMLEDFESIGTLVGATDAQWSSS
jgi:hypothetical protein